MTPLDALAQLGIALLDFWIELSWTLVQSASKALRIPIDRTAYEAVLLNRHDLERGPDGRLKPKQSSANGVYR